MAVIRESLLASSASLTMIALYHLLCFERGAATPRSESSAWMSLTVLQLLPPPSSSFIPSGALIHFFLVVLILGNWRLRRLEWLLFGLMAALFMWYSGNLLALNIDLHYGAGPAVLSGFSRTVSIVGFMAAVPLLVHVQAEYLAGFVPIRLWATAAGGGLLSSCDVLSLDCGQVAESPGRGAACGAWLPGAAAGPLGRSRLALRRCRQWVLECSPSRCLTRRWRDFTAISRHFRACWHWAGRLPVYRTPCRR